MTKSHLLLAERLLETCFQLYNQTETGLSPEIVQFSMNQSSTKDFSVKVCFFLTNPDGSSHDDVAYFWCKSVDERMSMITFSLTHRCLSFFKWIFWKLLIRLKAFVITLSQVCYSGHSDTKPLDHWFEMEHSHVIPLCLRMSLRERFVFNAY